MKHGVISESKVGAYTIERRPEGFRVVHDETGVSTGTFATYSDARKDVQTNQYQTALLKTYGKDAAIEILRGNSTHTQSAQ